MYERSKFMSHQKHQVAGTGLPRNVSHKHRKKHTSNYHVNLCEYDYETEKSTKKKPVVREDSTSSYEGRKYERPKKRKHRRPKVSEIDILKRKLNEIETLREQIEVFQSIISSRENVHSDHRNVKWLTSSCFSFLSALTCKKSKPEIVEIYGDSSKLSQCRGDLIKTHKTSKRKRKKKLKYKEKEEDLPKQHRITNNNTIVLPENYGLSRQQSGDQFMMNNLNKKLEVQVSEIKEIKETLKECINLLKDSGFTETHRYIRPNFPYMLDDFINLNRVLPAKFNNLFPNTCAEEGFLSLMNHTERAFDRSSKSTDGNNTQVKHTPVIQSIESLQLSKKVSKTTLTSDYENKFPEPIHDVYCQKRKPKEAVLKVSPYRCGINSRCHKPPRSITKSVSSYSVVAAQRKKNKKINKGRKPVRFQTRHSDSSSCPQKCPAKRSCFVRFIRFLCCKCN